MKRALLLVAALFGLCLSAAPVLAADVTCRSGGDKVFPVKVKYCSAKDGTGGHYFVRNKSKYAANACWEVAFKDGSRLDACKDGLVKTEPFRVECPKCGRKGKEVLFFTVKTYETPGAPVKAKKEKKERKDKAAP